MTNVDLMWKCILADAWFLSIIRLFIIRICFPTDSLSYLHDQLYLDVCM